MKYIVLLVATSILMFAPLAAQQFDEPDGSEVQRHYPTNGRGDQFMRIKLMPLFPLNFAKQLYTGGAIQLGYHRFLTSWLALGGDLTFTYNPTLGSRVFYTIPITASVLFQPTVWRFEFPLHINIGMAFEAYQSRKQFPALIVSGDAGAYYRFSENWSFGLGTTLMWMPQWAKDDSGKAVFDNGLFMSAEVGARYHF